MLERPVRARAVRRQGRGRDADRRPGAGGVNALRHCGYDVRAIPATPERLMAARTAAERAQSDAAERR